jgi:tetratricopeptide (TPR) repeat protein
MNNEIALIDLVRSLGFERPEALSNWIRDIIKTKENFSKEFIIEQIKQNRADGRPEKFIVNKDKVHIFVDNLCILKPYLSFFEKTSDGKQFYPYQQLKDIDYKKNLTVKAQQLKRRLEAEKNITEKSLKELPKVISVFNKNNTIDITVDSLREMIKNANDYGDIIDFSNSFGIAAWNDLSTLKEQLREKGESAETYRKIAEKLLELGNVNEALEALDSATSLSQDDGIAWSLKAKIYLDLLRKSKKDQMSAFARTEFQGFIEYPLDGEEHSINDNLHSALNSTENFHKLFIDTCFNALENWPCWENFSIKHKEGVERKNFKPESTNGIERSWVFFHFVIEIKKSDFNEKYAARFIQILRTFQTDYEVIKPFMFSMFSFESQNETPFKLKLTEILSWISKEECNKFLDYFIDQFEFYGWKWGSENDLFILSSSNIHHLFWDYLGREKFLSLYSVLESYTDKSRRLNKLESLCSMQLNFLGCNGIIDELRKYNYPRLYKDALGEKDINKHFRLFIKNSHDKIKGWDDLLKDSKLDIDSVICDQHYVANGIPKTLALIFICVFIELQNNEPTELGIKVISEFSKSKKSLQEIVDKQFSFDFLERLIKPVIKRYSTEAWINEVKNVFEIISRIQEEIDDAN